MTVHAGARVCLHIYLCTYVSVCMHVFVPSAQVGPVQPSAHAQLKPVWSSLHVAPFTHGEVRHACSTERERARKREILYRTVTVLSFFGSASKCSSSEARYF